MNHFQNTLILTILFYIFSNISSDTNKFGKISNEFVICEGDRPMGEVCALNLTGVTEPGINSVIIKDRCGENQQCTESEVLGIEGKYQCIDVLKPRRYKGKCQYDGDCVTNLCRNSKCDKLEEGMNCNYYLPQCPTGFSCPKNYPYCTKLKNSGEECKDGYNSCDFGLKCNGTEGVCVEFGSLPNGENCGGENMICQSGIEYNGTCVGIIKNGTCKKNMVNNKIMCEGMILDGKKYENDLECVDYFGNKNDENNYVCPIFLAKEILFKRYIGKYKDYDLKKIREDKSFFYNEGNVKYNLGRKDLAEDNILFYNAPAFKVRGLIDESGNVIEEKRCEALWLLKHLGGNKAKRIKVNIGLFFNLLFALII